VVSVHWPQLKKAPLIKAERQQSLFNISESNIFGPSLSNIFCRSALFDTETLCIGRLPDDDITFSTIPKHFLSKKQKFCATASFSVSISIFSAQKERPNSIMP
jgi:hypothetical protein